MDSQNILSKTAKGLAEATGKTTQLSRGARKLLKGIDGRTPIADLADRFTKIPEAELLKTLDELEQQGFVRKLGPGLSSVPATATSTAAVESPPKEEDLDFTAVAGAPAGDSEDYFAARRAAIARAKAAETAKARAEGEAAARAEAAAEAAAKAKADAEAAAQAEAKRAEAAAVVRSYHEAQARRVAEAKARAEAEAAELRHRLEEELEARQALERKAREDAERAAREAEARARAEAEALQAKLEAERIAREAEARARAEAEERVRQEIEARTQREAEARARTEAAERVREEIEARTQREAEARLRAEREERISRENEQRVLREAEALRAALAAERKAREEAALPAIVVPEPAVAEPAVEQPALAQPALVQDPDKLGNEVSRRFQEEQAKRDAERQAQRAEADRQRARADAEAHERERAEQEARQARRREEEERKRAAEEAKRRQQEEKARAQALAEEKARAAAQAAILARKEVDEYEGLVVEPARVEITAAQRHAESAPRASRPRRRIAAALVLLVVGALAAALFIRPDTASYEREATALLGTPVKIGSAYVSLLPAPALRWERVSIGSGDAVRIGVVSSRIGVGTLFGTADAFRHLELENVQIPAASLGAIIWGKGTGSGGRVELVTARGVMIEAPGLEVPALAVDAQLDRAGALQSLTAQSADGKQTFRLAVSDARRTVEISAKSFQLPFPGAVPLGDLAGSGTLTPTELALTRFELAAFGGWARGSARMRWGASWSVDGEFTATSMNPRLASGSLVPTGRLEGKGTFSMRAPTPHKLHELARLDATFEIRNGTLGFVDLARALQPGGARGGTTSFASLDGNAAFAGRTLRLSQLRLAAGLLNATGDAAADPAGNLIGRLHVDVASRARGTLTLGGTVAEPHAKR